MGFSMSQCPIGLRALSRGKLYFFLFNFNNINCPVLVSLNLGHDMHQVTHSKYLQTCIQDQAIVGLMHDMC
jgi:hypothetical protein